MNLILTLLNAKMLLMARYSNHASPYPFSQDLRVVLMVPILPFTVMYSSVVNNLMTSLLLQKSSTVH